MLIINLFNNKGKLMQDWEGYILHLFYTKKYDKLALITILHCI